MKKRPVPPPPPLAPPLPPPPAPDFAILLLAWNAADPSGAVLGGAALPPPVARGHQLAAAAPVVALYPHLPAPLDASGAAAASAAAADAPGAAAAAPAAPAVTADVPIAAPFRSPAGAAPAAAGVAPAGFTAPPSAAPAGLAARTGGHQLPASAAAQAAATAGTGAFPAARIIGLAERAAQPLAAAGGALLRAAAALPAAPDTAAAAARSQWPAGAAPTAARPQVPAAPYAGASTAPALWVAPGPASVQAVPATPPVPSHAELPRPHSQALRPRTHPLAGDLRFDPDPELPGRPWPEATAEITGEPAPAEAADLDAPEDDLTLEENNGIEPVQPSYPAPAPAAGAPAAAGPRGLLPPPDGLNARMIQYARQAAQLVRERRDFSVIYAPNWPAWLAALEIRNRTGVPLVLYAAGLAAHCPAPAERGWLLEVERMALRRAHLVLVPDEETRQQLLAQYGSTLAAAVRVVPAHHEAAVQAALRELAHAGAQ